MKPPLFHSPQRLCIHRLSARIASESPQTQQESHKNHLFLWLTKEDLGYFFLQSTWVPTPSLPSACHSMCTIKYVEHDPSVVLILGILHFMHEFLLEPMWERMCSKNCLMIFSHWGVAIESQWHRICIVNIYIYASTSLFL
jgi:hypothetical protein